MYLPVCDANSVVLITLLTDSSIYEDRSKSHSMRSLFTETICQLLHQSWLWKIGVEMKPEKFLQQGPAFSSQYYKSSVVSQWEELVVTHSFQQISADCQWSTTKVLPSISVSFFWSRSNLYSDNRLADINTQCIHKRFITLLRYLMIIQFIVDVTTLAIYPMKEKESEEHGRQIHIHSCSSHWAFIGSEDEAEIMLLWSNFTNL